MIHKKHFHTLAGILFLVLPLTAYGQATRTWVSGVGDDANPCSRTAPCKTFAGAISKTAPGGEIDTLDPGGFGAVTVTKSITIDGSGAGEAGVLVSGTNGIVISAPSGSVVIIRNLDLEGLGTGLSALSILSASTVYVENSRIDAFGANTYAGIYAASSIPLNLVVKNTVIRNCVTASLGGLYVDSTLAAIVADVDNLSVHNCPAGVTANNGSKVMVRNSDLSFNGIGALAQGSPASLLSLDTSVVTFNTTSGVSSSGTGTVLRLSNTSILDNTGRGITTASGGAVVSFVNNRINGNNPDGAPTSSVYQK